MLVLLGFKFSPSIFFCSNYFQTFAACVARLPSNETKFAYYTHMHLPKAHYLKQNCIFYIFFPFIDSFSTFSFHSSTHFLHFLSIHRLIFYIFFPFIDSFSTFSFHSSTHFLHFLSIHRFTQTTCPDKSQRARCHIR